MSLRTDMASERVPVLAMSIQTDMALCAPADGVTSTRTDMASEKVPRGAMLIRSDMALGSRAVAFAVSVGTDIAVDRDTGTDTQTGTATLVGATSTDPALMDAARP
jgi:hypothetical protein